MLFLSAEVAPFAKVGGLADVAGSLPKALRDLGHDVRVMMPLYRMIEKDPRWKLETALDGFAVRTSSGWKKTAHLKCLDHQGVPTYFLGANQWFSETQNSQTVYLPGSDQYIFFAKGALEAVKQLGWIPDLVHCNDWHTGFVPVLLREGGDRIWDRTTSAFTIHNLAYQGEFGEEVLQKLGLPMSLFNMHALETFGRVNFLKSGCVYSDQVNTVSRTYASEIQTPEYGCRLEGLMQHLANCGRLSGILNGIDANEFDPAKDVNLAANYNAARFSGKARCKQALQRELKLPTSSSSSSTPALLGAVTRLSSQKGMDLFLEAADRLFELNVQVVVQGLGDPYLANAFRKMQDGRPDRFRFIERFDPELAQRVYAGSDIFLMPSSFEPCGLGQMIAMRYGAIPIARATGGLADTVFEGENGFVFEERSPDAFFAAVGRALSAYHKPVSWKKLVKGAMAEDHSWSRSAEEYSTLYERALAGRLTAAA